MMYRFSLNRLKNRSFLYEIIDDETLTGKYDLIDIDAENLDEAKTLFQNSKKTMVDDLRKSQIELHHQRIAIESNAHEIGTPEFRTLLNTRNELQVVRQKINALKSR